MERYTALVRYLEKMRPDLKPEYRDIQYKAKQCIDEIYNMHTPAGGGFEFQLIEYLSELRDLFIKNKFDEDLRELDFYIAKTGYKISDKIQY